MITILEFRDNFKKKLKNVIFFTGVSLFFVLGLSFIQPFLYKSSFSVLIVQDTKEATDVYTSIKSADKLASLLQKIVKTSDFFDVVMSSKYNVSKDDFGLGEKSRRKQWNKMINVDLVQEAGILNFDIFYKTRDGAEEYAKAIVDSLVNNSSQFYGSSDIVKFRVINSPLTSESIAKPNLIINSAFGLFFGAIIGLLYVYFTIPVKKENNNLKGLNENLFFEEDKRDKEIEKIIAMSEQVKNIDKY